MVSERLPDAPKHDIVDTGASLVKGGAAVAGVVTGQLWIPIAAAFFDLIAEPLLKRRTQEFFEGLRVMVLRHEEEIRDLDASQKIDYEVLVGIAMRAAEIAARTRQKAKIELLQQVVVNAMLNGFKGDDEALLLHWVDVLSVDHFTLLVHFADQPACYKRRGKSVPDQRYGSLSSLMAAFKGCHPEWTDEEKIHQLFRELHTFGLISRDQIGGTMTANGALGPVTTARGRQLAQFVVGR